MATLDRCCKRVFSGARHDMGGHLCGKPPKFEHEGKRYCATHYPPNEEARRELQNAKWRTESEARKLLFQAQAAERDVVRAAKEWFAAQEKDGATADALVLAVGKLVELEGRR